MTEFKKDTISSVLFLVLGVGVRIGASFITDPQISQIGPREFPNFIGNCMIVLSLALLVKTLYTHLKHKDASNAEKEQSGSAEDKKTVMQNEFRALAIALICLLYAILFKQLGYFVSTFLAVTAICILFKEKRIWVYPLLYGVAAVIWAGFTYLLQINLP